MYIQKVLKQIKDSYTGANPALNSNHTRTDTTVVGTPTAAGLQLTKAVSAGTALPGSNLTYTITYINNSSGVLSNVVINDATPAFTTFVSAACGATPAPLVCNPAATPGAGSTGAITWTFGGTLTPGAGGNVSFQVQVQN